MQPYQAKQNAFLLQKSSINVEKKLFKKLVSIFIHLLIKW